jgi:uncharacterized protein
MSYLTDRARAASSNQASQREAPGQMFADVLNASRTDRRMVLRGGLGAVLASVFGGGLLSACGGSDDDNDAADVSYEVKFSRVARGTADGVVVPEGYTAEVLFAAGDAVAAGATAFTGAFLTSSDTERFAGGNHDGMHFYALPGVDANKGGLLAINHEFPDFQILRSTDYVAATATDEEKRIALSSVGVSVIEVAKDAAGKWAVVAGSRYNKRYTGNTSFNVSGPAASAVGATVIGTLNNCASGSTPWGTYLTCEETTDNYLDPTQPTNGYGWVVEIDPRAELAGMPVKRTALGRFDHENTAYRLASDGTVAIYMGDDSTPGCIYKFVPSAKVNATDRAANTNLLDSGTLYAARFNADGTGQWLALVQGQNGLVAGAVDPGNETQGPQADVAIDFATQADVLLNTKAAARVAGATLMDRPEWITVAPDGAVYCTCTNNSSRAVTDAANPRTQNRHGHIVRWTEDGNTPGATAFRWAIVLQAGDPSLTSTAGNLTGNINGDTFSSPDGIDIDPQGRLWVQTDMSIPGNSGVSGKTNVDVFGHNAMYHVDTATGASTRFLVGPVGCEITGLTYTPDLKTFFINIQHPTGAWPSSVQGNTLPPRSATIVVRRTDGLPVGA